MTEGTSMNGVFAIEKPAGITSNFLLTKLKNILSKSPHVAAELQKISQERIKEYTRSARGKTPRKRITDKYSQVKMGHGGTLDPLAAGVVVVGVGNGTKRLQNYLTGGVKTYETEALFGASTTSGDVEGELLGFNDVKHLVKEELDKIPEKFIGHIKQTPPIYSALKMNGKPLYEYARNNIPLPQAIKTREVQIYDLKIFDDCLKTNHEYEFIKPTEESEQLSKNASLNDDKLYFSKEYAEKNNLPSEEVEVNPKPMNETDKKLVEEGKFKAPLLHFSTTVSSGTYIRSIISDIGKALDSSAYMVKLIRTQQTEWKLGKNVFKLEDFENKDAEVWYPVLLKVLNSDGEKIDNLTQILQESEENYLKKKSTEEPETKQNLTEGEESKDEETDLSQPEKKKRRLSNSKKEKVEI